MWYRGSVVAVSLALGLCLGVSQASAEVFAYPQQGESQQQFEQDQFACHQWARGQTGVDPSQAQASAAAPPQRGGAVRGAAGGAALGAVGGAIGGDGRESRGRRGCRGGGGGAGGVSG